MRGNEPEAGSSTAEISTKSAFFSPPHGRSRPLGRVCLVGNLASPFRRQNSIANAHKLDAFQVTITETQPTTITAPNANALFPWSSWSLP
jgi:hypothetical protein